MSAIGSSWTWADDLEQAASMLERANKMSANTFVAGKFASRPKNCALPPTLLELGQP